MQRLHDAAPKGVQVPHHLSPSTVALLATAFVLLLSAIPVRLYEDALREKNHMFGDLLTYGFVLSCLGAFLVGVRITSNRRRGRVSQAHHRTYRPNASFPVVTALLSAAVAVAALIEFVGTGGSFVSALTSGQGEALRAAALDDASEGITMLRILPIGVPLLVWAVFRSVDLARGQATIYLCAALYGAILLLVLQRNLLIPFVLSVAVVLSAVRFHASGISMLRGFKFVLLLASLVAGVFALVAFFRGTGNASITTSFMGYVPASVNRLSALVHGDYSSAFSGQPAYTLRFLWYPPFVRRFVPMDDVTSSLGVTVPVDPTVLWRGEFLQIASAGLNPNFIWPTAFGYTFYDFGWYSCCYFLVLGVFAGLAWRRFLQRTPFGIIFYSYICSSIVLWGTDNFLSYPQIWNYVVVLVLVRLFDAKTVSDSSPVLGLTGRGLADEAHAGSRPRARTLPSALHARRKE